jgi:DNA-binding NarL/FixJ family response regulator
MSIKNSDSRFAKPKVVAKDNQEQPQVLAFQRRRDDTERRREGDETRLALIDSRTLVRVAMSYFLQSWATTKDGADNFLILPFSSHSEFLDQCPDPARHVDVVALNIGAASVGEERVQEDIRRLRDHLSDLPLVLMSDQVEPWSGLEALRQGIKGYIPTTLNPSVAIQAMRLVHAGGTFMPSDLLLHEEEQNKTPLKRPDATALNGLTTRQHEVLGLIRLGKPNKLIAAELNISESTVKVYVRQIMKKFGAINRTHACYLLSRSAWDGETERRRDVG